MFSFATVDSILLFKISIMHRELYENQFISIQAIVFLKLSSWYTR
uniref:Uncharacterized protein n=1 Tax=Arundo donax TaxID=35708 RepID=A0A0A9GZW3_ARUDO